jgi:hypothetical protein
MRGERPCSRTDRRDRRRLASAADAGRCSREIPPWIRPRHRDGGRALPVAWPCSRANHASTTASAREPPSDWVHRCQSLVARRARRTRRAGPTRGPVQYRTRGPIRGRRDREGGTRADASRQPRSRDAATRPRCVPLPLARRSEGQAGETSDPTPPARDEISRGPAPPLRRTPRTGGGSRRSTGANRDRFVAQDSDHQQEAGNTGGVPHCAGWTVRNANVRDLQGVHVLCH